MTTAETKYGFGLIESDLEQGRLILKTPEFDYDSFPEMGELLVALLSASIKEKQVDADLHSWLIDFEDTPFFLRAEHYSQSVWLEALDKQQYQDVIEYLANLFHSGF